jgi:hypothetical protein
MSDEAVFDNLPKYDPTKFQPPAWASGPAFDFTRKNGESSKSATHSNDSIHSLDGDDSDEGEEVWEDAQDELVQQELEGGVEDSPDGLVFTVAALQVTPPRNFRMRLADRQKLVDRAYIVKDEGNVAFTSKPPKTELAIEKYQSTSSTRPQGRCSSY